MGKFRIELLKKILWDREHILVRKSSAFEYKKEHYYVFFTPIFFILFVRNKHDIV